MTHSEVRELISCYAVGALDPDEANSVQEHLVDCGFCANLAREASDVAHYLPYAAAYLPPPAGSLGRLMAEVQPQGRPVTAMPPEAWSAAAAATAGARPENGLLPQGWPAQDPAAGTRPEPGAMPQHRPPVAPAPGAWPTGAMPSGRRSGHGPATRTWLQRSVDRMLESFRTPVFAPVAAMVVLVLGVAGWNMSLMGELKEERRQMSSLQSRLAQQTHLLVMVTSGSSVTRPLQGTALAPSAEIRLIMDGETNSAMVMASRLPPLPNDRVYQVWLGRGGARMPAGRLIVDEEGDGECNLQLDSSIHSYDSAWITLEPMRGSPLPNSPGVARGELQ